jgi:hypothetical protein
LREPTRVAGGVGWIRIGTGLVLAIAPRSVLRLQATDEPSGSLVLMTRTVGIRDLVVGVGSLTALRSGSDDDRRRWVALGLLSDVLDALAGAFGAGLVGRRGALVSALVPVPVIVADIYALSMMNAGAQHPPG